MKVNLKKNAIREDNRVSDQKQDFDVEEILDPSLTSPEPPRSDQIEAAAKLQVTELLVRVSLVEGHCIIEYCWIPIILLGKNFIFTRIWMS